LQSLRGDCAAITNDRAADSVATSGILLHLPRPRTAAITQRLQKTDCAAIQLRLRSDRNQLRNSQESAGIRSRQTATSDSAAIPRDFTAIPVPQHVHDSAADSAVAAAIPQELCSSVTRRLRSDCSTVAPADSVATSQAILQEFYRDW
jgi:hypothetical protein